ncbi:RNA polymerase II-associated protein 3 [Pycnococcus provasolii]|uniref:RNA polymerase II-associated protein 3 n=1 Tax=Pycnococcus provasolii TaxID=41880 RepID=A0A830HZH6_9CHLO|nr:RNA polymerase II-associated protein 3 [Pycnococcus provasolii]
MARSSSSMLRTLPGSGSSAPILEVVLASDVDVSSAEAVSLEVSRVLKEESLISQGLLRRVPVETGGMVLGDFDEIGDDVDSGGDSGDSVPIFVKGRTTSTDYDKWSVFKGNDNSDDDEASGDYQDYQGGEDSFAHVKPPPPPPPPTVTVPVTEEERRREAARAQAATNAAVARDEGNALYKKQLYEKADERYTHGLRNLPSAVLFANRAQTRLKLNKLNHALKDAHAAVRMDKTYVNAYVKRAHVLRAMGKPNQARSDVAKALEFAQGEKERNQLTALAETLTQEAKHADSVAQLARAKEEAQAAALTTGEGALLVQLESVVKTIASSNFEANPIKANIDQISSLLETSDARRSYFIENLHGLDVLHDAFREDNAAVLRLLALTVSQIEEGENGYDAEKSVAAARIRRKTLVTHDSWLSTLVACVRDRRLAVIVASVELLCDVLEDGEGSKRVVQLLLQEQHLESVCLMAARGPAHLHERAATMMRLAVAGTDVHTPRIAPKPVLVKLAGFADSVAEMLIRCTGSESDSAPIDGVAMATAALIAEYRQHHDAETPPPLAKALATANVAGGLLPLIAKCTSMCPVVMTTELDGGIDMVFRDVGRISDEDATTLRSLLHLVNLLCGVTATAGIRKSEERRIAWSSPFSARLDQHDAWLILVPLLHRRAPQAVLDELVLLLDTCAAAIQNVAAALVAVGATEPLMDICRCELATVARDALVTIMARVAEVSDAQKIMLASPEGVFDILNMLGASPTDSQIAGVCHTVNSLVVGGSAANAAAFEVLSRNAPALKRIVDAWYQARELSVAKDNAEALLRRVLREEVASDTLSSAMTEGQVARLVNDLRTYRNKVTGEEDKAKAAGADGSFKVK